MIRDFSPEQLAAAKRLRGLPPAEYQQALYDYVGKGGSLTELLAMKAILDRQDAQTKAQDAVRMAVQGGANPAPQTTVAEDMMRKLGTGVSSLPVRSDMYDEANYAGGGIVAFNGEDDQQLVGGDGTRIPFGRRPATTASGLTGIPREMLASSATEDTSFSPLRWLFGSRKTEKTTPESLAAQNAGWTTNELGEPVRMTDVLAELPALTEPPARAVAPSRAAPSGGEEGAAVSRTRPVSTLEMRGEDLQKVIEDQRKRVEKSVGEAPKPTTLEAQVQEATRLREKALKDAGVKSIKDRVNEISADAAQARNDRDADRWLAAAQGFFAMGAARSPWALKNISEGLGVTTTQLREVEKDYRKGEQLRKDRIAVLEEAKRQEALGNFDRGHELYKEAERIREKHAEKVMGVEATLLKSYETQLSQNIQQQAILEQKRAAIASAGAQKEYYAYLRDQERRSKDIAAYNAAVQRTFDSLIKLNPVAMADPNAAETLRAQAVNHVLKTNPEFAKLAGVDTSTIPTAPGVSSAGWGKATVVGGK